MFSICTCPPSHFWWECLRKYQRIPANGHRPREVIKGQMTSLHMVMLSVNSFFTHLKEDCLIHKQHLQGKPLMPAIAYHDHQYVCMYMYVCMYI